MDNQRLLIWSFFGVMLFLTWQAWIEYQQPPPGREEVATQDAEATPSPSDIDQLPDMAADEISDAPPLETAEPLPTVSASDNDASTVKVVTDVFDIDISTRGATLQQATLLVYPVHKDDPNVLVQMLSPSPSNLGLLQTGLRISDREQDQEPNHRAIFRASQERYELNDRDSLEVAFTWTDGAGITVSKTFRFERGSYVVGIRQTLTNGSAEPLVAGAYAQLLRRSFPHERSMFDVDSYSFDGPIIYDGDRSRKLDRDDLLEAPFDFRASTGWIATIQHHFLNAVVPPPGQPQSYRVLIDDNVARASAIDAEARTIAPGETAEFSTTAFIGPKLQSQMDQVDETLKLTVDYGWLTIISEPLFWVLSFVHSFVQNWGLAIILVTMLIKLAFYKLTEASGRSMAKMREIQPRMKALQERYKDDRQALSQAMMDLYKREKVNPAAGCLPILVQMPFFLAFYWVLLESVEMRQAPFALWITDLSSRDPYFILPLIMGAAMLLQQRLNPAPADPVQARVMQIMPVMFTGFFAFFPSGLVLYWVTNTVLSIAQQWHINKVVAAEGKKRRSSKKARKNQAEDAGD
jgi:YidC/Oxa1 family membrane protein insertase